MTSTGERTAGLTDQADSATAAALSVEALRSTAKALEGVAVRTPLVDIPALALRFGVPVAAKCEHLQPVGAFKIRGAYTAVSRIPEQDRKRGVITYSSGNHGQAVAMAARLLGTHAVVVMPERAPAIKVAGVKQQGAEVVIAGNSSIVRFQMAQTIAQERGLTMIPPYESLHVIAGQGTCGLEILEARPDVDTILVPVGGGGLIAGVAAAVNAMKRTVRVIGVEPEGAPKLARALEAGHSVKLDHTQSIADGLLPLSIGELPFRILSSIVHESVQVSEGEISAAVRFLYEELRLVSEPSGTATTAALLAGRVHLTGSTVVVVSGGNVDPQLFNRLVTTSTAQATSQ
jgi:threo-3-hydroxy-L-aspartate ammonia-lyase